MINVVLFVLFVAMVLYLLLGGADFGVGIIETFAGKKSIKTLSKIIAPVWEVNHIWLILIIVILFTGFPKVYTTITTQLHFPVLFILLGITLRGTAFTFRYYDVQPFDGHVWYNLFFRISSWITPFFIGVVVASIVSGNLSPQPQGHFFEAYFETWLSIFPICTGLFFVALVTYIANVLLLAEPLNEDAKSIVWKYTKVSIIMSMILGTLVFISGFWEDVHFDLSKPRNILAIGLVFITLLCSKGLFQ